MTVPQTYAPVRFIANGVTTVFPFNFLVFNADDIQVLVNGAEATQGFTITGLENDGGGSIIFSTPPAYQSIILISRILPILRKTDYQDNGDLLAETINRDFDRRVMTDQQLQEQIDRAVKVPPDSETDPDDLIAELKADADRAERARDEAEIIADKFGDVDHAIAAAQSARDIAINSANSAHTDADRAEAAMTAASVSGKLYRTASAAQADIDAGLLPVGTLFNVNSSISTHFIDQYENAAGTATPTGKSFPSTALLESFPRSNLEPTFLFNGPIPGATIASAIKDGVWFGATASSYSDAPAGMAGSSIVVEVFEMTGLGRFKYQRLVNFSSPSKVLLRRVDTQLNTATAWTAPNRSDTFLFNNTITIGAPLSSCTVDGVYYGNAGAYPDLPAGYPTSRAFTLFVYEMTGIGRFKFQELRNFTTPFERYIRKVDLQLGTATSWVSERSVFVKVVNSGSFNSIIEDGTYTVITAAMTDAPPVSGSWFLRVSTNMDSNNTPEWCLQEAILLNDSSVSFSRITRPSIAYYPDWKRNGGGGGSGGGQFQDKLMAFPGDSFFEFGTQASLISARLGATGLNMGFGGCRMGKHQNAGYDGMCMYNIAKAIGDNDFTALIAAANQVYIEHGDDNRQQANLVATTDWTKVDYIVISFGTNDFGGNPTANNVIGNVTDFTPDGSTFCGSVNYVINRLLTRNPKMRIVFLSPIWRYKTPTAPNGIPGGSDVSPNLNGDYVIDFVDALIACCEKNHVEVYDGYRTSGIGQLTASAYIDDGVHPTAAGYQLLADKQAAFLFSRF